MDALTVIMTQNDRYPGTRNWRFTGRIQQYGTFPDRKEAQCQYQDIHPGMGGKFPWHQIWVPLFMLTPEALALLETIGHP